MDKLLRPANTMGSDYLSIPSIPASGSKIIIFTEQVLQVQVLQSHIGILFHLRSIVFVLLM